MISVNEEPSSGTWGALQLLKEEYKKQDEDWQYWWKGMFFAEKGKGATLNDKKIHVQNRKFKQLRFNTSFLEEKLKNHGELHCEYCGKPNLRIYQWFEKNRNKNDMATADHFYPKVLYPELSFTKTNLKVACSNCNTKKGKKEPVLSDLKFPYMPIESAITFLDCISTGKSLLETFSTPQMCYIKTKEA